MSTTGEYFESKKGGEAARIELMMKREIREERKAEELKVSQEKERETAKFKTMLELSKGLVESGSGGDEEVKEAAKQFLLTSMAQMKKDMAN
jgi:hypothetical protein